MSKEKKNNLGTRMKGYEAVSKYLLTKRTPVIIRIDGKAFHTFTRGMAKPFDEALVYIMQNTMKYLCENIQGCVLGYTQSDEITLVLIDYQTIDTCAWFDNEVQKMASISASLATLAFNKEIQNVLRDIEINLKNDTKNINQTAIDRDLELKNLWEGKLNRALFDSRVFNVPQYEVINNLIWRQQDATRNSINSLAQSLFSHKELQGINCKDLQNKMLIEKDVNWNNLDTCLKRGSCCIKDEDGKWFIDTEIPIFTEDRDYINKLIFLEDN